MKGEVHRSTGTLTKVLSEFYSVFQLIASFACCFLPIQIAADGGVTGAYSAALTPDPLSDCATLVNVRLSHCQPTTKSNSS